MGTAYRPTQWGQGQTGQLYGIVESYVDASGGYVSSAYFFDAVLRAEHFQELAITRHPVQVNANNGGPGGSISDHAYLLPARLTLEIGMSDTLDRFNLTDYSSDPSKSIAAYHAFLSIQARRSPLIVMTRLKQYENMLIQSIRPVEDYKTRFALKAMIVFEQILMGLVTTTMVSAAPQITDRTDKGTAQTATVPAAIQQRMALQSVVPSSTQQLSSAQASSIPGSGEWSSGSIVSAIGAYSD